MQRLNNRRVVLTERPTGKIATHHFKMVTEEIVEPPEGHILLRVILAQIAPAARAVMTSTVGFPSTKVGDGILCAVVGEVVVTARGAPPVGSIVTSFALWEEYAIVPAAQVLPVVPNFPLTYQLGIFGLNGLTAYFGMTSVADVKAGETVVVSGAAGGVGHIAGQIAQVAGARVIGITGSVAKNQKLEAEYGFAGTVNRRSPTFRDDLRRAVGTGPDVYFDTAGGPVLDTVLPLMAHRGRIVCAGDSAQYDDKEDNTRQPGPRGIPQLVISKGLRVEGIFVADFLPGRPEALRQLAEWLSDGKIKPAFEVRDGLDSAPEALVALLSGENFGQVLIRMSPDPR
jgi:NADPH-dependent curcumin reductase CurA